MGDMKKESEAERKGWAEIKKDMPVGSLVRGTVARVEPFGLLVDIGYGCPEDCRRMGLVEIVASKRLPTDGNLWPVVGTEIVGEVFFYRENRMQVDIRLWKEPKPE